MGVYLGLVHSPWLWWIYPMVHPVITNICMFFKSQTRVSLRCHQTWPLGMGELQESWIAMPLGLVSSNKPSLACMPQLLTISNLQKKIWLSWGFAESKGSGKRCINLYHHPYCCNFCTLALTCSSTSWYMSILHVGFDYIWYYIT